MFVSRSVRLLQLAFRVSSGGLQSEEETKQTCVIIHEAAQLLMRAQYVRLSSGVFRTVVDSDSDT